MVGREVASWRVTIPPVEDGAPRPLWSVMIPTYHCAGYLRENLASVLAQDPGPDLMQIEVVDDCSTQDDPAAVVEEVGRGRVGFYRQPENVGHIRNFDTCLERSRGRLVHLLHGDDGVRDGFYRTMQQPFLEHPEIGAAFCRYIWIDEASRWLWISAIEQAQSGILVNWLPRIAVKQRIQPPSMVVRREVYETLGGFDNRIRRSGSGEDWEMWVRIAAHYPVWFELEPLALYRWHASSITGQSLRTGANIADIRRVIEIIGADLPSTMAAATIAKARENYGLYALSLADQMVGEHNAAAALAQIREGLKCSRSLKVVAQLAYLVPLWMGRAAGLAMSKYGGNSHTS